MRITYLNHSGYVVEEKDIVLIFDYYKGYLPPITEEKKIYVFASHVHYDHFKKEIFQWADRYKNIQYILSDDIMAEGPDGKTIYIGPRQEIQVDELQIKTLRSTDEGVAFFVRFRDKVIYHAGDLNWWHWEEESEAYNLMMKRMFQNEIGKIEGERIDVAFVPLDPRQGEQYYWGLDYFMKHTDTRCIFPMHMWEDYDIYERLMENPAAEEYKNRVMHVIRPQQVFERSM